MAGPASGSNWWTSVGPPQPLGTGGQTAPLSGDVLPAQQAGGNFGNLSDPSAWMALVGNPQQLRSWVQAQAPQLFASNPGLLDYYVSKVQGQPGANPTEQAGSAQYWTNKILQDPGLAGAGGQGGAPAAAGLGGLFTGGSLPGMDPSYGFDFDQAMQAIQRSAAAKGTLLTGGTMRDLAGYGAGLASREFGNIWNRNYQLASLGENAAAGQGNLGANYANNAANTITGIGNATAAGQVGSANAWNQSFGGLGNLGLLYGAGFFGGSPTVGSSFTGSTPGSPLLPGNPYNPTNYFTGWGT